MITISLLTKMSSLILSARSFVLIIRKKEKKAPLRRWVGGLVARFGGLFGPIVFWVATA